MIKEMADGIFSIEVKLTGNPLKNLNSYLICAKGRNLLIDTGFDTPECLADLQAGLKALDADMNITDIFVTHMHADHCGLVSKIASKTSRIYMNPADREGLLASVASPDRYWKGYQDYFLSEGCPARELGPAFSAKASQQLSKMGLFNSIDVVDGTQLDVGDMRFQCICTPGHTQGHMCLYREQDKTLFTGDHVLFDISPSIMAWPNRPGALSSYLKSLEKIRAYEVKLALPAHRSPGDSLKGRADELIAHHLGRLEEVEFILTENPGISGYEVASRMKWSIRAAGWENFPSAQKWFAVGEALAHLEFLQTAGRIEKTPQGRYHKV